MCLQKQETNMGVSVNSSHGQLITPENHMTS